MTANFPNVISERLRLARQGKDAYVHRIMTLLFIGRSPDPWNLPCRLSPGGANFLHLIDEVLFGEEWETPEEFYWEYKLLKRPEDKEHGWPDFAALWTDRVLMIELRTEVGRHRDAQVEWYMQLGAHNYGGRAIDLVYVTPDPIEGKVNLPDMGRFRNCTWAEMAKIVEVAWGKTPGLEAANAQVFGQYLSTIGKVNEAPDQVAPVGTKTRKKKLQTDTGEEQVDPLDEPTWEQIVEVFFSVAEDGQERALELPVAASESAKDMRRRIRGEADVSEDIRDVTRNLEMWIWHEDLGGEAISEAGLESGCEIRVARRSGAIR